MTKIFEGYRTLIITRATKFEPDIYEGHDIQLLTPHKLCKYAKDMMRNDRDITSIDVRMTFCKDD